MIRRLYFGLRRKLKGPAPILAGSLVLILAYQNFSHHTPPKSHDLIPAFQNRHEQKVPAHAINVEPPIPSNQIAPGETYKALQNSNLLSLHAVPESSKSNHFDIREYAPSRPVHVAFNEDPFRAPEIHSNRMNDVGSVWLEREMRPLVKPLEDQWLNQVNGQLRGLFGAFKPVDDEDWPEPGQEDDSGTRGPASDPGAFPGMPQIPGMPSFQGAPEGESDQSTDDYLSLKTLAPEDVKLTKANEVTIGFKHGTMVSCEIGSGQSKVRLSRPVSRSSSFDISHESAENRNSVGFRLSW
ncbi:MAG: hypothetical protein U1E10_15860 [Bdellovibrionales bacterium]|nr:hypothetical protein [Bdellovibrionales bacterium]